MKITNAARAVRHEMWLSMEVLGATMAGEPAPDLFPAPRQDDRAGSLRDEADLAAGDLAGMFTYRPATGDRS